MKVSNRLGERAIGSTLDHPDILLLLEASRYISGESSLLFKSEVLSFVGVAERVSHNFTFSSKIVSVSDIITSKILHSLSVTDKNWLSSFNGFSLHFHSEVRVT